MAISAQFAVSPADVPALPWWQFEQMTDWIETQTEAARRRARG